MIDMDRFIQDLKFQRDRYSEMVTVTEEQRRLLSASADLDQLMHLVERKRTLLDEIERTDQNISDVKAQWVTLRDTLEASRRAEVEAAVDQIARVLEDLVRLEEECHRMLQNERGQTLENLKQVWQRKQVRKQYGGAPNASDSRFLDQKE